MSSSGRSSFSKVKLSADVMSAQYWRSVGAMLAQCWRSVGAVSAQCWRSNDGAIEALSWDDMTARWGDDIALMSRHR